MTGIIVLCVVALVVLMPVLAEALRTPMTRVRQAETPGQIAHLPSGATHFQWRGEDTGKVIVCIHGLSTPAYVFAATERSLAALGYRVLSYDLFGRGYSDRALGRQDIDFFLGQLRALLRHQEVQGAVSVLGFSMGGQIAAAFAAEEGAGVDALILVAPSGLSSPDTTGQSALWTAPIIGGWMTRVAGGRALRRELVDHKSAATVIPDFEDRQAAETRTRGYLPALLSSRRHLLSQSAAVDHGRIFQHQTPVLAIWGSDDPVIPMASMGRLAQLNPDAHHAQIPGAGHNVLQTHPAQVADALKAFLKS